MFSRKNSRRSNERIIYEGRPNMIIGCKKAIWGVVVLFIIIYVSNPIKSTIINLQTYFISYLKFGIMGYVSLAIILLMLIDLLYIIWQLLSWYSTTYTITTERMITKRGVINTKKTYMPFKSIQDIDLSQSIIGKIINVGTVTAYSAYDNNDMKFAYISNPGEVEDILFKKINEEMYIEDEIIPQRPREEDYDRRYRNSRHPPQYQEYPEEDYYIDKYEKQYHELDKSYDGDQHIDEHYYDDYEYNEERNYRNSNRKHKRNYNQYEYEEFPKYGGKSPSKYDYEYYNDNLEDNIAYAMNDIDKRQYHQRNEYEEDEPYYNDYDYDSMENFYNENRDEINIDSDYEDVEEKKEVLGRDQIIQRHFDKFNR